MPDGAATSNTDWKNRVLVVDDEPAIVETLQFVLEDAGYRVKTARTAKDCLEVIARERCDLVLLDLMLPDRPGLEVLEDIGRINRSLPVVMLTAYGTIETAVEATRLGAANFLTKPWNNSKLLLEIKQTLERRRLEDENARLRSELERASPFENLIGKSEAMLRVFVMIRQVAGTSSTVLVSGESGTGKELVARAIHNSSPRADKPFVTVNSGRIPGELLESTLFGHVGGAFAGAVRDRRGCFEIANEGTIFLDEVSTLSQETQMKLLGVIQEREFVPVGSNDPTRVDVRIVAATNDDLAAAVRERRFREDLFYRLDVIEIELPPLRDRMDDVPLLVDEFLTQFCRREKNHFLDRQRNSTLRFTPAARAILMAHDWPGNVRELRNAVERAVVLASREELGPELLPTSLLRGNRKEPRLGRGVVEVRLGASLSEMVEDFERRVVLAELEKHGYNQTETAKALRVALSTLNQKIQRLGINVKRLRIG
jgi:DNA-binding NtrC family response regulator